MRPLNPNAKLSIYILVDPNSKMPRYIGFTYNIKKRFAEHLSDRANTHKTHWIHQLLSKGQKPIVKTMRSGLDHTQAVLSEMRIIKTYRNAGILLVNGTDGGDGTFNREWSEESSKRASESQKRRPPASAETRAKLSMAGKGRSHSLDHSRKISEALKRRHFHHSEETRIKISEKLKGKFLGRHLAEDTKRKISLARKGITFSVEHRAKLSQAKVGSKLSASHRRNISIALRNRTEQIHSVENIHDESAGF